MKPSDDKKKKKKRKGKAAKIVEQPPLARQLGFARGQVVIADDFDAPLTGTRGARCQPSRVAS